MKRRAGLRKEPVESRKGASLQPAPNGARLARFLSILEKRWRAPSIRGKKKIEVATPSARQ